MPDKWRALSNSVSFPTTERVTDDVAINRHRLMDTQTAGDPVKKGEGRRHMVRKITSTFACKLVLHIW